MPALDEQVIPERHADRAALVAEYKAIILRCDEPHDGDPERVKELMKELDVKDDDFRAQCRIAKDYKQTKRVSEDDAPIRAAEAEIPGADNKAREVFEAAVNRLVPHVETSHMADVLAAIVKALPQDRTDPGTQLIGPNTPIRPAGAEPPAAKSPEELQRMLDDASRLMEAAAALSQVERLVSGSRAAVREARGRQAEASMKLWDVRTKAPWLAP